MQDNKKYAEVIMKGRDAYQDYTLIEKKVAQLKEDIYKRFQETTPLQDLERKNLWQALHVADKVLEYLLIDISAGKNALSKLDEIEKVGKPTVLQRFIP